MQEIEVDHCSVIRDQLIKVWNETLISEPVLNYSYYANASDKGKRLKLYVKYNDSNVLFVESIFTEDKPFDHLLSKGTFMLDKNEMTYNEMSDLYHNLLGELKNYDEVKKVVLLSKDYWSVFLSN